jgi:limonene-1,2-epoxide hydrolase
MRVSDTPMQAILNALDALDLEAAVEMFAPDATLTTLFGDETAQGHDRIRAVLGEFLQGLHTTNHALVSEWNPEAGVWIAEMSATYELSDYSRRGPFRRAIILRVGDGGITDMRIYGAHERPLSESGRPYEEVRAAGGWLPTL